MRDFIVCLGYNSPAMIRGALENFEATTTDAEHRRCVKTLFNPGFPGNSEQTLKNIASEFGWWFANIPNEGVMGNHNRVIHEFCHMEPGDTYTCFDPDVRWQQNGWLSAAKEILFSQEDVVFVCAAREFYDEKWLIDTHGRTLHLLPSGARYARFKELVAWSTGVWKGDWLAKRPRDFKAAHEWYGWAEHADVAHMQKHKKKWLSMVDHYDHHLGADPIYCEWKVACAKGICNIDFGTWLNERNTPK